MFAHVSKKAVWQRIRDRAEQAILESDLSTTHPSIILQAGKTLGYGDKEAQPNRMYATGEHEVSRAGRRRKPARRVLEDAGSESSFVAPTVIGGGGGVGSTIMATSRGLNGTTIVGHHPHTHANGGSRKEKRGRSNGP